MAKVTGIGGVFFKVKDADASRKWYQEHLGIPIEDYGGSAFKWRDAQNPQRLGSTVWSPFPENTKYFQPSTASFMVNYRVDHLDELLAQLRAAGVRVDDKVEDYPYGKFGWIYDPDGNKIELWEPRGEEGQGG
jgi:catechol 2,3-dioxygenase-like lactoylglutathione lyase family enzyme